MLIARPNKYYQAVTEQVCIKKFGYEAEKGWYNTPSEALANYKPEVVEVLREAKIKGKPGRKPKNPL